MGASEATANNGYETVGVDRLPTPAEEHGDAEPEEHFHYVLRFATAFLRVPLGNQETESSWVPRLRHALNGDSRVTDIQDFEFHDDYSRTYELYEHSTNASDLLVGEPTFEVLRFSGP